MTSPAKQSPTNSASKPTKTQFKATEKWCELIAAFRNGMPCGKHWHMFQFIEDSFSGCEAVEWMYSYLKNCPEFNKVTKENALQLLQKFMDAGVMEEFKKSKGKFEYSSRLYKMTGDTPPKQTKSSARHVSKNAVGLANDGYTSDSDIRSAMVANAARKHVHKKREAACRPITEEDVHLQWKMALVTKFEETFGRGAVSVLIDTKSLSGINVFFNATHVAANGMVSDLSPEVDLPEWVVSSLNFLARWSDDVSANLPHYPGVEADLLRVIVQSFENIPEPLIPYAFHKLALCSVAPELLMSTLPSWRQQLNSFKAVPRNNVRFESIENLLTDMASVSLVGCPSPLLPSRDMSHVPRASRSQSQTAAHGGAVHTRSQSTSRYNIRLETAFVGPNNETYTTFKFEETKPSLPPRQMLNNTAHFGDAGDGCQQYSAGGRCQSVQNLVWQPMTTTNPHNPPTFDRSSASFAGPSARPFGSNLENIASIKHADSTASLPVAVDLACEELKSQLPPPTARQRIDPVASLQMTLLFMPPPERRRLQMFLRLLSRLLDNKVICQRLAPPNGDLHSLLVGMFAPIFVRPKSGDDQSNVYNHLAVERLSALLLDKHAAVFAVPDWLNGDVNNRLDKLRRLRSETGNEFSSPVTSPSSPATPSPRSVPAYCQRISMREYMRQSSLNPREEGENENASPTHDSLVELLAGIVTNKDLTKRARSKRLKEFEKTYPEIYKEYFASLEAANADFEERMSNKENGSGSSNNSPSTDYSGKGPAWMPRIKEPMLLKKIRARFGNE